MEPIERPRILCVDDEPGVLDGLTRRLRRHFTVRTAPGAAEALDVLEREEPFAVVVSDMRMPGMDGAAFLAVVRARWPDTVRILLTGHADLDSAISAVNDGQIFRFLSKPCPLETLLNALEAATEQHALVRAQRAALAARNSRETARTQALLAVANHALSGGSVEQFLHAVCRTTVGCCNVAAAAALLWDRNTDCLRPMSEPGVPPPADLALTGADAAAVAHLRAGDVVEIEPALARRLLGVQGEGAFATGLAVPMICRGALEGVLLVGTRTPPTEDLVELLQGIAHQAGLTLADVRSMAQQRDEAEVPRLLMGFARALATRTDEPTLWSALVRSTRELLDVDWVLGFRLEPDGSAFRLIEAWGVPEPVAATLARVSVARDHEPMLTQLLGHRGVVVWQEPAVLGGHGAERWMTPPWLAIPLVRSAWVGGWLAAGYAGTHLPFTPRQLQLAEGVAHQASTALQNARLIADLEAADRVRAEFVATVSHELRTPLNVILGYTELLATGAAGALTPEQQALLDRVGQRGRDLFGLIEATLQARALREGDASVGLVSIALRDVVTTLETTVRALPHRPGVTLHWEPTGDLDAAVVTDPSKLALVVRNLVGNAFKFTERGTVTVRIRLVAHSLVIEVADTGPGIAPEQEGLIFEMFRQGDGSNSRRHDGLGLGLYLVKEFTTRLGGQVEVETATTGSTFRLVLPGVQRGPAYPPAAAS